MNGFPTECDNDASCEYDYFNNYCMATAAVPSYSSSCDQLNGFETECTGEGSCGSYNKYTHECIARADAPTFFFEC